MDRQAPPGRYFVRLFARNACGTSPASNELVDHDAVAARPAAGDAHARPLTGRARRRRCRGGRRWRRRSPRRWCWPLTPPSLAEAPTRARLVSLLQAGLTGAVNTVPFAVFDAACVALVVALVAIWWASLRGSSWPAVARPSPPPWLAPPSSRRGVAWFQLAWGLNYARPPVDVAPGAAARRPSRAAEVAALLARAVGARQSRSRGGPCRGLSAVAARCRRAGRGPARGRGARTAGPRPTVPARPKLTLARAVLPHGRRRRAHRAGGARDAAQPRPHRTRAPVRRSPTSGRTWPAMRPRPTPTSWRGGPRSAPARRRRYSGWLFLLERGRTAGAGRGAARGVGRARPPGRARTWRRSTAARRPRSRSVQRVGWRVYDGYLRSQGVRRRPRELFARGRADRARRTAPPFVPRAAAALTNQTAGRGRLWNRPFAPRSRHVRPIRRARRAFVRRPWPARRWRRRPRRRRPSPCPTSTSRCPTG